MTNQPDKPLDLGLIEARDMMECRCLNYKCDPCCSAPADRARLLAEVKRLRAELEAAKARINTLETDGGIWCKEVYRGRAESARQELSTTQAELAQVKAERDEIAESKIALALAHSVHLSSIADVIEGYGHHNYAKELRERAHRLEAALRGKG